MKASIKLAVSFGALLFANNLMYAATTPNEVKMICNVTSPGTCQCTSTFLNHTEKKNLNLISTKTAAGNCPGYLPQNTTAFTADCYTTNTNGKSNCLCQLNTVGQNGVTQALQNQSCPTKPTQPPATNQAMGNGGGQSSWDSSIWSDVGGDIEF